MCAVAGVEELKKPHQIHFAAAVVGRRFGSEKRLRSIDSINLHKISGGRDVRQVIALMNNVFKLNDNSILW